MKKIFIPLIFLVLTSSIFSQVPFYIISSSPSNGASGIASEPDSVLLQFVFSQPLDTSHKFYLPFDDIPSPIPFISFLAFDPKDSIRYVSKPRFSATLDTISVYVKLAPGTDYCIVITGAFSFLKEPLDSIFVLNFSTSSTLGNRNISGTVSVSSSSSISEFHLPGVLMRVDGKDATYQVDPALGVVALFEGNPVIEPDRISIRYAANVKSDFSFQLRNVRDGVYYPLAGFDLNRDGIIDPMTGDLVVFYDANNDGLPDSINVTSDITGLNLSGQLKFEQFTAKANLDSAKKIATGYASDAVLRGITSAETPPFDTTYDGKFIGIEYIFHSNTKGYFSVAFAPFTPPEIKPTDIEPKVDLPATFLDSDSIFKIAEKNGGSSFRSKYSFVAIMYALMNFSPEYAIDPPDTTNVYWGMFYLGFESTPDSAIEPSALMAFYMNPTTGSIVSSFIYEPPKPFTLKERLDSAKSIAKGYASDAVIRGMKGFEFAYQMIGEFNKIISLKIAPGGINSFGRTTEQFEELDGRVFSAEYIFYSNTKGFFSVKFIPMSTPQIDSLPSAKPGVDLPVNFIDSDSAFSIAESEGGKSFREAYPFVLVSYSFMSHKPEYSPVPPDTENVYWGIFYAGSYFPPGEGQTEDIFVVYLDSTGKLVKKDTIQISAPPFYITSSTPKEGETGVKSDPDSVLISFVFSQPVDTGIAIAVFDENPVPVKFVSFFAFDPFDSVRSIGKPMISSTLDTLSFYAKLAPNTDYSIVITGAYSKNTGSLLDSIFTLNFTTSSTPGNRTISGTIQRKGGQRDITFGDIKPAPQQGLNPARGFVALLDKNIMKAIEHRDSVEINVRYATRIRSDFSFELKNVRDGVYYPVALFDANYDGFIEPGTPIDILMFPDPDKDGLPDSISVTGDTSIVIDGLFVPAAPPAFTARSQFGRIDSAARQHANDARLMYAAGLDYGVFDGVVDTVVDGKGVWNYGYRSATMGQFSVVLDPFSGEPFITSEFLAPVTKPIEPLTAYIDSDSIVKIAETLGKGKDYRMKNPVVEVRLFLGQAISYDTTKILWHVIYVSVPPLLSKNKLSAIESSDTTMYIVLIDPKTGALIDTVTGIKRIKTAEVPKRYELYQNYPNPFNPETRIVYEIPERTRVKLVIYDILGREVTTLVNSVQTPGRYEVVFNARNLPSGIYLYRLEAGKFLKVKKMVLLK